MTKTPTPEVRSTSGCPNVLIEYAKGAFSDVVEISSPTPGTYVHHTQSQDGDWFFEYDSMLGELVRWVDDERNWVVVAGNTGNNGTVVGYLSV